MSAFDTCTTRTLEEHGRRPIEGNCVKVLFLSFCASADNFAKVSPSFSFSFFACLRVSSGLMSAHSALQKILVLRPSPPPTSPTSPTSYALLLLSLAPISRPAPIAPHEGYICFPNGGGGGGDPVLIPSSPLLPSAQMIRRKRGKKEREMQCGGFSLPCRI